MGARLNRPKGAGKRPHVDARSQSPIVDTTRLPAPSDLEAYRFEVDGDEYAVFAFELPEVKLPATLSRAEREVVRAVAGGCSNAEIAKRRGTSTHTVANQLRSIYSKLGVTSRLELIRSCVEHCSSSSSETRSK